MIKPRTLFITNREDVSVEYLIEKYRKQSDKYLRINSEDIGLLEFEVNPAGNSNCIVEDVFFDLSEVNSVLFKRVPSRFNTPADDQDRPYLNNERKHFFEGLYLTFSNAKWINPMFATHIAERKIYQLHTASRMGLDTPRSIITNNRQKALDFLRGNQASIIKPVSNGLQVLTDITYSIYTTAIDPDDFGDLALAKTFETPVFLQNRIMNSADIRVTIVGQHLFAVKIVKEGNEVDWRKPEIIKKYELMQLPAELEKKLLQLNKFLGMIYSAIDLILTPKGEFIFLEINPVGEWVWLEHELGIDISGKLIQELL
jgi:glutathione synthase/RimK-type ligase-like ATP-grasp enzyme